MIVKRHCHLKIWANIMREQHFRQFTQALSFCLAVAIVAGIAVPPSALAQEATAKTASETRADRRFTYSRDVSYGHAIGPRTPGRTHSVETGPTELILSTLKTGLQPISDTESASIVAGISREAGLIGSHVSLGLDAITGASGTDSSAAALGNMQGSIVNGAVGQATGAIRDALGSVRGILGGGQ